MKKGYVEIAIVLDRSGSMASIKDDTIGGFNTFLEKQKNLPEVPESKISLYQFDDKYEAVYEAKDTNTASPLDDKTFVPRGSTALHDAIGRTISSMSARFDSLAEDLKPEKIVFVVITDGCENSSKEFALAGVRNLIQERIKKGWEFVYLGADVNSFEDGQQLGFSSANVMQYVGSPIGAQAAFCSVANNTASFSAGRSATMSFTPEDRKTQEDLLQNKNNKISGPVA